MVFCPRLDLYTGFHCCRRPYISNFRCSLKFKSSSEIWNLDKWSYCPEWTFYEIFFFIDLKFPFEFISSLFEDFLTTSRYWIFSNKTGINWALKWFIWNRIFQIYLCCWDFLVEIWIEFAVSTSVVTHLTQGTKQIKLQLVALKRQEYWCKVNRVSVWRIIPIKYPENRQLHLGEMKIIESHSVYSPDYTIKFLPPLSSIILTSWWGDWSDSLSYLLLLY